jgi:hypothetical protein
MRVEWASEALIKYSAFTWIAEKDGDESRERVFAKLAKVIDYLEGKNGSL